MNFNDIWTVAKKELRSCFTDKLILIQIILIPFAIVFGYSLLMSVMAQAQNTGNTEVSAYYVNAPDDMEPGLETLQFQKTTRNDIETVKNDIANKNVELLIVFPQDFKVADVGSDNLSEIQIWYNSENSDSLNAYNEAAVYLNAFQPKVFTVNSSENTAYDLGDENAAFRNTLGTIMPIMIFMAVFLVCMNLAAESIAGDKERGFLNTMLITPVKRTSIAAGKSLCIFIVTIIGGISAFAGMALALPLLAEALQFDMEISYSITEYLMLFVVTITAVFVLAGILLIISTLAKDVKQATNIAPIIMLVIMVAGMLTMNENFNRNVENLGMLNHCIPVWNTMMILKEIIRLDYSSVSIAVTCITNIVFTVAAIFAVGKCFENERILNG